MSEEPELKEIVEVVEDIPGLLDRLQGKLISRKFLVFVLTTVLLFLNRITAEQWIMMSALYIGTNTVLGLVSILKGVGWPSVFNK